MARSPCGLSTTLAVQKCELSLPELSENSAPTAATPAKDCPLLDTRAAAAPPASSRAGQVSPAAPLFAGASDRVAKTATAARMEVRRPWVRPLAARRAASLIH